MKCINALENGMDLAATQEKLLGVQEISARYLFKCAQIRANYPKN